MRSPPALLRLATTTDIEFLAETDLHVDADAGETYFHDWSAAERREHRAEVARFVSDPSHCAWLACRDGRRVGMLMCRFHDPAREPLHEECALLCELLPSHLTEPFCSVFQLWVAPAWRRLGVASSLKRRLEEEAEARGARLLYTHTRAANDHVVELNRKLGYDIIRRGPTRGTAERVSLLKRLASRGRRAG